MKKKLKKLKKKMKYEIEFAYEAGFEGMLIMIDEPETFIYLESTYDDEMIEDIVYENGWEEECVLLDFAKNNEKYIRLEEAAA